MGTLFNRVVTAFSTIIFAWVFVTLVRNGSYATAVLVMGLYALLTWAMFHYERTQPPTEL